MPFPVIAKVQPGSSASHRPQLYPGLVLVAINKSGVRIRPTRAEIEERLRERPLHLVFEAPAPERFDYFGTMKRWKKYMNKERTMPSPAGPCQKRMSMTMSSFFGQSGYGGMEGRPPPPL